MEDRQTAGAHIFDVAVTCRERERGRSSLPLRPPRPHPTATSCSATRPPLSHPVIADPVLPRIASSASTFPAPLRTAHPATARRNDARRSTRGRRRHRRTRAGARGAPAGGGGGGCTGGGRRVRDTPVVAWRRGAVRVRRRENMFLMNGGMSVGRCCLPSLRTRTRYMSVLLHSTAENYYISVGTMMMCFFVVVNVKIKKN